MPATPSPADQVQSIVLVRNASPTKEEIARTVGHNRIRYVGKNEAAAKPLVPDRLTAVLGVDGRIKQFQCG